MRILERENYYNVINGYKELFLASKATATADEAYKTGTTFDEVYALYNFDRELRNIYLKYLLKRIRQITRLPEKVSPPDRGGES
jgi:abortive infection bacteriophage resistance protein